MKTKLLLITLTAALISCQSPEQTAQLARIGDIALAAAERSGKITPAEAALAREVGSLILTPAKPAITVGEVTEVK